MNITKTEGLIAAPFTPLLADGSVNLEVIGDYAQWLHAQDVVGAFICGTTGEGMSLTTEERRQIAQRWVAVAPKELRVIVHVGHTCLADACQLAAHAQAIGADSISCLAPFFFKPQGVEGLVTWCQRVAAAAPDLPFYYYHIPSMTGANIDVSEFLRQAGSQISNLAGVKFTYEDLADLQRCLQFADGKYDILFGRDELLLTSLELGVRGAVGSTYNFAAPLYQALISSFDAGETNRAAKLQQVAVQMIDTLIQAGGHPTANFKRYMSHVAVDCGPTRLPLHDPTAQQTTAMLAALEELHQTIREV